MVSPRCFSLEQAALAPRADPPCCCAALARRYGCGTTPLEQRWSTVRLSAACCTLTSLLRAPGHCEQDVLASRPDRRN